MTIERKVLSTQSIGGGAPPSEGLWNWHTDVPETKFTGSGIVDGDGFGSAIAIDGNFMVVGAKDIDATEIWNGGAYVYEKIDGVWTEMQELLPSVVIKYQRVGAAVAISGSWICLGGTGGAANGGGSFYIFENQGGTWVEVQTRVQSSDIQPNDSFSGVLHMSGDLLMVGATNKGEGTGAVYVFKNIDGTWTETQKIMASDALPADTFGSAISLYETYMVIGARGVDEGKLDAGAAYIFENQAGTWVELQRIQALNYRIENSEHFGISVTIHGTTIAVGANAIKSGIHYGLGLVFIFEKEGPTWVETQELTHADKKSNDAFGSALWMDATTLFISSTGNDGVTGGDTNCGAAYVFELHGGTWCEIKKLEPSDQPVGGSTGRAIAISGGSVFSCSPEVNSCYRYDAPAKDTSSRSGIIGAMLADNPVVCYDFSEVAGTKAIDLVLGHIADHTGSPWLGEVSGVPGSDDGLAARYNTGKHTRIRAMAALDAIDTHITVEVVYKAAGWSINAPILAKWSSSFNSWLLNSYPEGWLSFSINNGTTRRAEAPLPATGVYHHIIGRYDGVNVEIWIDGIKAGTISGSGNIVTTADPVQWPEYSGLTNNNGAHESYDAVAIYDYALTDQQIANHYTATGL